MVVHFEFLLRGLVASKGRRERGESFVCWPSTRKDEVEGHLIDRWNWACFEVLGWMDHSGIGRTIDVAYKLVRVRRQVYS